VLDTEAADSHAVSRRLAAALAETGRIGRPADVAAETASEPAGARIALPGVPATV
jgi:hypothetical protein